MGFSSNPALMTHLANLFEESGKFTPVEKPPTVEERLAALENAQTTAADTATTTDAAATSDAGTTFYMNSPSTALMDASNTTYTPQEISTPLDSTTTTTTPAATAAELQRQTLEYVQPTEIVPVENSTAPYAVSLDSEAATSLGRKKRPTSVSASLGF